MPKATASFKNHIAGLLAKSAQAQLDAGKDLSDRTWLTVRKGKVVSVDFDAYAKAAGRQKTPPAFDGVDLSAGETNSSAQRKSTNATSPRSPCNTIPPPNAEIADEETIKIMNPLNYIGKPGVNLPQNWRIRVGTNDRDTSLQSPPS